MLSTKRRIKELKEALFSNAELPNGEVVNINYVVNPAPDGAEPINITVIDCETASIDPNVGIDLEKDLVIELCMANIVVDANTGLVLEIQSVLNQLNHPGFEIHQETTDITGIVPEMLIGKRLDIDKTTAFVRNTSLVIAHNAAFDKPILSRAVSHFLTLNWACSCSGDIDWKAFGMPSKSLKYILFERGYFYDAHRATPDVFALIQLLSDMPDASYAIINSATKHSFDVRALNSPFSVKDNLKSLGFSPLYIDKAFIHWQKQNLSYIEAERLASDLNKLYGISPADVIFPVSVASKYL